MSGDNIGNAQIPEDTDLIEPKPPLIVIHREGYGGLTCPECGSDYPRRFWLLGRRRCINQDCRERRIPDIAYDAPGQQEVRPCTLSTLHRCATVKKLMIELAEAQRERDFAIERDRQPYPTADAYEKACAGLEEKRKIIETWVDELKKRAEKIEADVAELKKSQKVPRPKKAPAGEKASGDRLKKTEAVVTAGQKLETEILRCFTTVPADLSGPWMDFRAKLREVEK